MSRLYRLTLTLAAALVMLAPVAANAQTAADGLRLSDREPAVGVRLAAMAGAGGLRGVGPVRALRGSPAGRRSPRGTCRAACAARGVRGASGRLLWPGVCSRTGWG